MWSSNLNCDPTVIRQPKAGSCNLVSNPKCIGDNHQRDENSRTCKCGAWEWVASYKTMNKPSWRER